MRAALLFALASLALGAPARAQTMNMPATSQGQGPGSPPQPVAPIAEDTIGGDPPPPPITDHAADGVFGPAAMAAARARLRLEHGGEDWSMVLLNLVEFQTLSGGAYRWDGEASYGGDIYRLFLKSEGDGAGRDGVRAAEVQALFSRAISPGFDLQAGLRQDVAPGQGRTYATLGFEGLAPYWFNVSGALFLSTQGELLGRLEATYDLRLTQRLVLQPRVELNFAAQDTRETQTGSGLSNAELGLRLRYEISPEFAPYIGVSYDRMVGMTADYARLHGEGAGAPAFVAGIRTWF